MAKWKFLKPGLLQKGLLRKRIDYEETFSPVAMLKFIWILLSMRLISITKFDK